MFLSDKKSVLIWDRDTVPDRNCDTIVLWREYSRGGNEVSIPSLVEESADSLRNEFLCWVNQVGEINDGAKTIIDKLMLRNGCSYWWMTSIGYKDSYKKFSWVTNAIKILALKRWIRCNDVSQAMLVTDDKKLSNSLSKLFDSENIDFDSIVHGCNFSNITLWKLVYQKIPSFLRAIIWFLFYIVKRWRIVVSKRLEVDAADTDIVFISYLDNIVGCVNSPESFNSSYWGEVPNVLNMNGCKAVWAHFYVDSYSLSVKDAISLTSKYNRLDGLQSHFMLDSFVSFRVLFRTVIDWLYLIRRAKAVKKMI